MPRYRKSDVKYRKTLFCVWDVSGSVVPGYRGHSPGMKKLSKYTDAEVYRGCMPMPLLMG